MPTNDQGLLCDNLTLKGSCHDCLISRSHIASEPKVVSKWMVQGCINVDIYWRNAPGSD